MSLLTMKILDKIQIPDILTKYGIEPGRRGRIPCPIHDGKDPNFCYTDRVFHCWVCDAAGNVVDLVAQLNGISTEQAETKINNDFGLGLTNRKPTYREKLKAREIARRRAEQAERTEDGRWIYNRLASIRRELFLKHGDECEQVVYLDRILDAAEDDLAKLASWRVDLENLETNLKGCATGEQIR